MDIKPFIVALSLSLNLINFETGSYSNMAQNPIILDMDFCTDVDDAVSVRMATTLDDMGVCTLMAVGLCTTSNDGSDINIRAVHGLLSYDGYGEVPIGKAHIEEPDSSPYWGVCSGYSSANPNVFDAVELYKDVLRTCYNKVTIVTTGYLTNIQCLLEDAEGYNLVRDNCERIVITGGTFPSGWDNNFGYTANAAKSVRYVEEHSPVQLVYVPNDVGGKFTAGGLIQKLSPDDVLSKALSAYGVQDGRAAWDPTAVFVAAVPEDASNFIYVPVKVDFYADGSHLFTEVSESYYKSNVAEFNDSNTEDGSSEQLDEVKTVSPLDMFERKVDNTSNTEEVVDSKDSIDNSNVVGSAVDNRRVAVRYKSNISAKQYQDMIEGIISYEYLR